MLFSRTFEFCRGLGKHRHLPPTWLLATDADCQLGLIEPVRNVPGTNQAFCDITTV